MIETMQKRINEIKQQDRKSLYEIANEIGISESTLYKLMSKGELFTPAEQKITAYLKGYLTKDEKLEAYRLDNEELKAENERLKQENKELAHYLACMTEQRNKANTCLQEIKGVVTALYMNNWLQMNETARKSIQLLQELITKAEEE
jgi:transcriptional regulator with XRE-family HTH domain